MKIISGLRNIDKRFKGGVLTLGIFDGVHIGHQKILKKASTVLTFSPHPIDVLSPGNAPPLLTSLEKRMELLSLMGIKICVVANFTNAFSRIPAKEFVSQVLVKKLSTRALVVSTDIAFGYQSRGRIDLLSRLSKEEGFRLIKVTPVYRDGEIVSSTRIRRLIRQGCLIDAERLLGRPYSVTGTVMRGYRRGSLLGFPTANIRPHHEVLPPTGVYCGFVVYNKKRFNALANFGFRPTFYGREKSFEINIFDFKKDIYHKQLEFIFKYYLRRERVFHSKEALIRQIEKDRKRAMSLLCHSTIPDRGRGHA